MSDQQTIFALASAPGVGGVAVVRVSGVEARRSLSVLTGIQGPKPRHVYYTSLRAPDNGMLLDHGMAVYFQGPASFTGEDVVEYYLHGGRAVVAGILSVLGGFENCRMAEAGEFTKRAFLNGKMDLTEAEAVADLVHAETESQRAQALLQMDGALSRLYNGWTQRLAALLAHQEAEIEFPDEDLPEGIAHANLPELQKLWTEITAHLDDGRRGEILREGVHVAIIGAPNAGKSSLLNALAGRDAAIVSDIAGTTRDVVEVHLNLGGYPVIVSDTAGLRESVDAVEQEGVRRARDRASKADLKIALFEGEMDAETQSLVDEKTLIVFNKADLGRRAQAEHAHLISTVTGQGIEGLVRAIGEKVSLLLNMGAQQGGVALTRTRHRQSLEDAKQSLDRAMKAQLPELAAEDMRLALRALGSITGKVHVEDLLDRIFKDFCIGK